MLMKICLLFSADLVERFIGSARRDGRNARRVRKHETGTQDDLMGNVDQPYSACTTHNCRYDDVGSAAVRHQRCNHFFYFINLLNQ